MVMEYIKEIFDNYNQISIEDKKKLSERIIKIQDDDHDENFYFSCYYGLGNIDKLLDSMVKAKNFGEFYNSLNDKQKKEFQTRVYLTSSNKDIFNDNFDLYEYIAESVKTIDYKIVKKKNEYTIDFEKLENVLEEAYLYDMSEKIVAMYKNIVSRENYNQILFEMLELVKKCSSIIIENVNDSTRNEFQSLSLDRLVMTILLLLDIDKIQLDNDIEYRKKLRQCRDDYYKRKKESHIIGEYESTKKIVKRRANKRIFSQLKK